MQGAQQTSQKRSQSSSGPAIFYGYCSDTKDMRMMDYSQYVSSVQDTYANVVSALTQTVQNLLNSAGTAMPSSTADQRRGGREPEERRQKCGCEEEEDCHCKCCIRDADVEEFARCGEVRVIPLTLENDTRREREVKLQLGGFSTAGGREVGWDANLSETEFKLPPCGEKTVLLTVRIDCGRFGDNPEGANRVPSVDECKVAYATIRAEGCLVRPIVIAVAVLPNDCGAYNIGCQCGCC